MSLRDRFAVLRSRAQGSWGDSPRSKLSVPPWALRWGLNILFIFLLIKGYGIIAGRLKSPELELKAAMFPTALSGPIAVLARPADQRDVSRAVTYTGSVAADEEVPVFARVEGWVLDIQVREGDQVRAGQVIARLDTSQLSPEYDRHRFAVNEAQAGVERARQAVTAAQAGVERARFGVAEAQAARARQQIAIAEAQAAVEQQRVQVAEAEAARAAAEQEVAAVAAALEAARAQLDGARADHEFWVGQYERVKRLHKEGAVSSVDLDGARQRFDGTRAQVEAVKAGIAAAESRLKQARARLLMAERQIAIKQKLVEVAEKRVQQQMKMAEAAETQVQQRAKSVEIAEREVQQQLRMVEGAHAGVQGQLAALQRMRTTLGYAEVRAPQAGVVSARLVDHGVLVRPGMPLIRLAKMDRVRVRVKVAERDIGAVKVGTPVSMRFEALKNPYPAPKAAVTRVFPEADPTTRTTTVEIYTENPGGRIKLNMYAVVDLVLEEKKGAVVVPRDAVLDVEGQSSVFVVDGNFARAKPVKLGMVAGDSVEVTSGVQPQQMVIYQGQRSLVDGQEVAVKAQ